MLIDTTNTSSLSMAKNLNYEISKTWKFYSLLPKKTNNHTCKFDCDVKNIPLCHYVKSWRWLPLNYTLLQILSKENRILCSDVDNDTSFAILSDSEHFEKTIIVTLHSGSVTNTIGLLLCLQNFCAEKNYQRIQILTKDDLPPLQNLEYKMSFHLLHKSLHQ